MTKRRKEFKRVVVTEECVVATLTDDELRSRLEIAVREALSVVEHSVVEHGVAERLLPFSENDTRADEQLLIVNDFAH